MRNLEIRNFALFAYVKHVSNVTFYHPVDVKDKNSRKVATFGFEDRLLDICFARGYDDWAMEVLQMDVAKQWRKC